jgi:hypothetical protein
MAELVRHIELRRPGTDVDIKDLLVEKDQPPPSYLKDPGRSVCAIGSPRASFATEWMLAKMFGLKPFSNPSEVVPLRFLWSPEITLPYDSAFSPGLKDGRKSRPRSKKTPGDQARAALVIGDENGGKSYVDSSPTGEEQTTGRSFGVVLAQQRAAGDVWMVVAGLTGPATFGCASAVAEGSTGAVPESRGGDSKIRWDVVATTVERTGDLQGDPREAKSPIVVASGTVDPKNVGTSAVPDESGTIE